MHLIIYLERNKNMFNKKLKRSIKEVGKEITAMRLVNATIQMLYKTFENDIKKIKEKLEKFDRDIRNDRKILFGDEKRFKNELASVAEIILKLEERTENRLGELNDRVSKLEDDIRGLTSAVKSISEELVEAKDVLKEFIKVSGYDVSVERNKDYMKAYQVKITKNGRDNIEGTEKKNK